MIVKKPKIWLDLLLNATKGDIKYYSDSGVDSIKLYSCLFVLFWLTWDVGWLLCSVLCAVHFWLNWVKCTIKNRVTSGSFRLYYRWCRAWRWVCFSIYKSNMWILFQFVLLILNVCWQKCENMVLQLKHCLAFPSERHLWVVTGMLCLWFLRDEWWSPALGRVLCFSLRRPYLLMTDKS